MSGAVEAGIWTWLVTQLATSWQGMTLTVLGGAIVLLALWRHYADSPFRVTRVQGAAVTLLGVVMACVGLWLVIRGELAPPDPTPWWQFWR